MARIPCPTCAGTAWASHEDRHARTAKDVCSTCKGGGTVQVLIRWDRTGARPVAPIGKLDGSGWGRCRAPHNDLIRREDYKRVVRPFGGLRRMLDASDRAEAA